LKYTQLFVVVVVVVIIISLIVVLLNLNFYSYMLYKTAGINIMMIFPSVFLWD